MGLSERIEKVDYGLPEIPPPGLENIYPEGEVCYGVGHDAEGDASRIIEEEVVGYAGHHAGEEEVVLQSEEYR